MDVTSAINSLGTDYVSKVSQAMQDSATGNTAKTEIGRASCRERV